MSYIPRTTGRYRPGTTTSAAVFAAAALATVIFAGCGRNTTDKADGGKPTEPTPAATNSPSATAGTPSKLRVALVMSGPRSDNGWNSSAAKAVDAIKAELGLAEDDVKSVDNQKDATSQAKSLEDFAAKKFNLVFGHGTEYEAAALKIESNFPNTMFVISSGSKVGKNTMPIIFRLEDGAYLEGMLAAGLSKTGKIGCVGATKEAPLERIFAAFERGAKVINPKIQMIPPTYTGDWDDANKAKQQALALLNQGADVIMQDVDSAAKGVFTAVQEFNKTHPGAAWALGTNGDQNSVAPDVVVASAPIYTDKAFVAIAKQAKAGTLKANDTPFGMKDGVIDFVVNPALKSKISVQLLADIESTRKTIIDGSTDVLKDK